VARPMPRAPPVINATLPLNLAMNPPSDASAQFHDAIAQ
jgi:hypothetical protein